MRKLKIELKVAEIDDGNISHKEEMVREIDVFEEDWIRYYESMKEDNDIMKKLDMVYGMIDRDEEFKKRHGNVTLCYGCQMPINKNEEKERFEERGESFIGNCWECFEHEKLSLENIEYEESELSEQSEQEDENSNGEESSNKRKRKSENKEKGGNKKKIRTEEL
ncbi:hypothetical protein RhiirA4_489311, partial [Rhizophagus irregularis]